MSDFKAKMHQFDVRWGLGLHPDPTWGAYSAPLDLLAGFKVTYFKWTINT